MSGWNHTNANWNYKTCVVCSTKFKPKSGPHKFCSEQCKGKWKYIIGTVTTETQYKKISGNWKRYLARLKYVDGRKRNNLTTEILLELLEKQEYRCALSGIPLTCNLEKGTKFIYNASVDRIKAGGEYTKDNIQLVCKALNCWRSDTSIDEFVALCKAVANNFAPTETGE